MRPEVVVMVPTYNETENIDSLLDSISKILPEADVLVVDDNSPDGTWQIVQEKIKENNRIHLLHRYEDRGRGTAGIAGFKNALDMGASYVVEMDGDFSHNPIFLPGIVKAAKNADVVLGSRYVDGGEDCRGFIRKCISRFAGLYIKTILGYKVCDPTSGYRCFSKEILEKIDLNKLKANDPFIVTEVLYRCYQNNAKIVEVPIVFRDRKEGQSKLGFKILLANLWKVIRLKLGG